MALTNTAPDDENEDAAETTSTPVDNQTTTGSDNTPVYSGDSQNNTTSNTSETTGTARPTSTSQVANPSGYTDVNAYEQGNQSGINYLAGQTATDLNNQTNNVGSSSTSATQQATSDVNAGTPQYSSTADQSVISNPTNTTSNDYDTVVNNLLGTYSGPATVNPYYTGATTKSQNATQAGQLLSAGTPEGTAQYLQGNQGITGQGNSMLDAYLLNQNPGAQQTIQPAANQALGTTATTDVAINQGNNSLIPGAKTTASNTQAQTQADINNAITTKEAAANQAVNTNVTNYQNTESQINDFLNNPTVITNTPTPAQQAVLSALGMSADQWNNLVNENTQLQQANYVNQLITQGKQQITHNPDGSYVYTATGKPVQFPSNLTPSGVNLASSFTPLDPTTLYNLQNSVTPQQAQDIDALNKLMGQQPFLTGTSAAPTNLFSYNPNSVDSALQSALQSAFGLQSTENKANAPITPVTPTTPVTPVVPSVPNSTGGTPAKIATGAAGASAALNALNLIVKGSKLWNSITSSTGVTPAQLADDIKQGTNAIDASTQTALDNAINQINNDTQATFDSQIGAPATATGDQGLQTVGTGAIDDAANLGDTVKIDSGTPSATNIAGGALGALNLASGIQKGGAGGAIQAAGGANSLLNAGGVNTGSVGTGVGAAGSALGIYNGIQQGGVTGYGSAAANTAQLAGALLDNPAISSVGGYIAAPLAVYSAIKNYQSGATGSDAMNGATAGAAIGSLIVPGIGTVIGAVIGGVVGAIASAFGPGRTDPETTDWNSYLTAVQQQPNLAAQVKDPFLLLAGMFDEKSSTVPIYNKFGRMNENGFTVSMTQQINNAFKSGAINAQSSPTDVYTKVVSPWMQSMGNWDNVGSQYKQGVSGLIQQMIGQYMGGTYTQNWNAVGGDYNFGNTIQPYLGGPPPAPTAQQQAAQAQQILQSLPPSARGGGGNRVVGNK